MGAVKNFVKGAATVLPEIRKPVRKPSLNEKLMWTGIALIIYMVMAVTPLTGVPIGASSQTSYSSIIFASQQGTLMTLGIGPIRHRWSDSSAFARIGNNQGGFSES